MTHAMPALLVGLTALVTSGLVHAGYGLWWLSQHLLHSGAAAYDWTGALAVSGTATTVVLLAGLLVRRMVASSDARLAPSDQVGTPVPARIVVRERA